MNGSGNLWSGEALLSMLKQLKEEPEGKDIIIEKQNKKISSLRKQKQCISGLEGRGAEHRTYLTPVMWGNKDLHIMVLCRSIPG